MNKYNVLFQIFLSLILGYSSEMFSQSDEDSLWRSPNRFVTLPTHLIDPVNPALQVGYECGLGKQHAIQGQVGLILNQDLFSALILIAPQDSAFVVNPRKGYKLRLEYRYYLDPLGQQVHPYLSFELQYQQSSYGITQAFWATDTMFDYGFPIDQENGSIYYDDLKILKTKFGLNGKIGILFVISRFMTIDCYGGLGAFFRVIEQEGRLNPADYTWDNSYITTSYPGKRYLPNLPVGFALGFQF